MKIKLGDLRKLVHEVLKTSREDGVSMKCRVCGGTGKVSDEYCATCAGTGTELSDAPGRMGIGRPTVPHSR